MHHPQQHAPQIERSADALADEIAGTLLHRFGKLPADALPRDWLDATILTVRNDVVERWVASTRATQQRGLKQVNYLSLEFLIGRLLSDTIRNLGRDGEVADALRSLGVDLASLETLEPDAALGNGGLGRLAACFMDSLASMALPAFGYGIRYINGMFSQRIDPAGEQVELPETWLANGNPWEIERRDSVHRVGFGGAWQRDDDGRVHWTPAELVEAVAVDMPVVGWRGRHVNTLRLWTARAIDPLQLEVFNRGDFTGALADQTRAETLVRVLYPNDSTPAGQELRLRQEYFFASASIQDIVQRHLHSHGTLDTLPDKAAIQLNDTHPAIGVAELLRLLIDEHQLPYEAAWDITRRTFAYTNHTLLPEALESWPLPLLGRLLPRHLELIFRINADVLAQARTNPELDPRGVAAVSLIDEAGERRVRMANLAFAGSHSVNGVAALHSQLMRETVFADLNRLYAGRINNKTNGITPRRWLGGCNPGLTALLRDAIGPAFTDDLRHIAAARSLADDAAFRERFLGVKRANKALLVAQVAASTGLQLDPDAMFDVQVKRIHEYKRQLLNILHTMVLYERIRARPQGDWVPRVKLFAGKAASSYARAKQIIRLANDVAHRINADPVAAGRLQVVFLPDYNVSLAERIMPAADLSEQISTAGMEASGTGNMKLALNGALTIGTLDGANIEMRDHIGAADMEIFGMTAAEVAALVRAGYRPTELLAGLPELEQVLAALRQGEWSPDDAGRHATLVDSLLNEDRYMLLADFAAYDAAQSAVDRRWRDRDGWAASAVRNVAGMGWFSSDRTIAEYAAEVWQVHG
ncbi:glycogen/starch/alpha-glucan phosphorylase [Croceibacterium mercuriale]|uniref:glycogen/starch/alpha-glucan phosphorylase n=1 Tax=Croceibacterium mercuriale TaxID=1572751 RepID=UPI00068B4371|nr:glycogen/starch/alpha-glucan phosphorylase [Croceibacterium mercuriale]